MEADLLGKLFGNTHCWT